jgi:hypothetical protein
MSSNKKEMGKRFIKVVSDYQGTKNKKSVPGAYGGNKFGGK